MQVVHVVDLSPKPRREGVRTEQCVREVVATFPRMLVSRKVIGRNTRKPPIRRNRE